MTGITREQARILNAIKEKRFRVNLRGRYEIAGEERPERKERERLVKRGLIRSRYGAVDQWSVWYVTDKGEAAFRLWLDNARRDLATE